MSENQKLKREQLKHFVPLTELSDARLDELLSLVYTEKFALGMSLFREGDIENQTMYLLSGDVHLTSSDGSIDTVIRHTDEKARHPLDDSQPRQSNCVSSTPADVLRIDNSVLDYMMMWDQVGMSVELEHQEQVRTTDSEAEVEKNPDKKEISDGIPASVTDKKQQESKNLDAPMAAKKSAETVGSVVLLKEPPSAKVKAEAEEKAEEKSEAENSGDDRAWIRKMSHIMAFKSMPPANIKYLLDKMEAVEVRAGENIVQQGDVGEHYYVLVDGQARVTRTVELATLKPGRSFGEEALLSGAQRNASVTMLEDGMVMRLDKRDFNDMLREPMLNRIAPSAARLKVAQGAHWLDIRHAKEFNYSHLPEAINIPLHELRLRIDELDKEQQYICYCRTGHRSSAAAFLMVQNGFNASVLTGGVQVMARDLATS